MSKNCLASSAKGGLFLKLLIAPHRVVESAIFSLSHRVLLARAGHRSCRHWSFTNSHNKSSCACTWTVKEHEIKSSSACTWTVKGHDISKDRWTVSQSGP